MAQSLEKANLLEAAGYNYNFDRMMYVNRGKKKAFSVEFIEDNPQDELASKVEESTDTANWRFYFNSQLPDGIRRELERVLG